MDDHVKTLQFNGLQNSIGSASSLLGHLMPSQDTISPTAKRHLNGISLVGDNGQILYAYFINSH